MGVLSMSDKERLRKAYLEMVFLKRLMLLQASQTLELSYCQAKRVYRRYKSEKDAGLTNQSRGRAGLTLIPSVNGE
jgi:hypothetical protein